MIRKLVQEVFNLDIRGDIGLLFEQLYEYSFREKSKMNKWDGEIEILGDDLFMGYIDIE